MRSARVLCAHTDPMVWSGSINLAHQLNQSNQVSMVPGMALLTFTSLIGIYGNTPPVHVWYWSVVTSIGDSGKPPELQNNTHCTVPAWQSMHRLQCLVA